MTALLLAFVGSAHAGASDGLTITIRPNAFYAVSIDTDDLSLDLGTVALYGSTQTVKPATVTIESTFAQTDLMLHGAISSAGPEDWTFDASSATVDPNEIAVWATFTNVQRSTAPNQTGDYFSGTTPGAANSDMVDETPRYVGSSLGMGTSNLFECNTEFGSKDMDGLPPEPNPAAASHLWLYFRMPSTTADNDPQSITFTITATAPN